MKELILDVVNNLPDDITIDDFLEALFLRVKINKSIIDVQKGNTISHQDVKRIVSEWK